MYGIKHRLNKLCNSQGIFNILALDHSLTHGKVDGLDDIRQWIKFAQDNVSITGIVINSGTLHSSSIRYTKGVIVQCYGNPDLQNQGRNKVLTCSVENVIRMGGDAVSVQINMNSYTDELLYSISDFVSNAHKYNYPVLFMINGVYDMKNTENIIRIVNELGADLIKINVSNSIKNLGKIQNSVPVLCAGGETDNNIVSIIKKAMNKNFSGFCIGRNIFQSSNPKELLSKINNFKHE